MHRPNPFSSATLHHVPSLISRSTLRCGFLLVLLALGLFALSPMARAVDPPPDGGYPGNNTAEGDGALQNVSPNANSFNGGVNTAIGFHALFNNTSGTNNTATGSGALFSNINGAYNVATGVDALFSNTSGGQNTATGFGALGSNTTGRFNTATGFDALVLNTTGFENTATGFQALLSNTTGRFNTANGYQALYSNTTGNNNTANGDTALYSNTTGGGNVATGVGTLQSNTTGKGNTANGNNALFNNTGSFNIAVGSSAGTNLTTGSNDIDIGNAGVASESNTTRIGTVGKSTATFIAGIRGTTTANSNAVPVVIDSAGQLGTVSSSRRFKDEIKPMDNSSEAILGLKPVTFHYKTDKQNTPQFGLIAEEVAKVNPDLVVRDDNGEIYTVRYEAVNAMLLNEFLKEHRNVAEQRTKVAEQESTIAELKTTVAQQQKQIEALTATVQQVTEKVELAKAAPQLVTNP